MSIIEHLRVELIPKRFLESPAIIIEVKINDKTYKTIDMIPSDIETNLDRFLAYALINFKRELIKMLIEEKSISINKT